MSKVLEKIEEHTRIVRTQVLQFSLSLSLDLFHINRMQEVFGLSHLLMTVFLHCFANMMVVPAITDVTMAALCPGEDECSLVIYITGAHNAAIGLGSAVVMPVIGKLSDTYGRKPLLTLPITLSLLPLVILAYSRGKYYVYAYYALKTLISMTTEGSVQFLAFAYVADNVEESRRASVFGIMSGFVSSSFVLGNISSRFLSTSATFQVAAAVSIMALVYMRVFLHESILNKTESLLQKPQPNKWNLLKNLPSLDDVVCLLRMSPTFSKAAVVAFLSTVADVGLYVSMLYYLKAKFHFNKDQFADLMIISGTAGSISQLILMPKITPLIGEKKMLSVGLFFSCAHMIILSIAWSPWVPYASALIAVVAVFTQPCLRSIASKQTGPNEQGRAQGCITGICSLANIVSPLAFTPLTALFLSDNAPFYFPGFSILCSSFAAMAAFSQSIAIKPHPAEDRHIINHHNCTEVIV